MLDSDLKQVGGIISCSNKHWKSINLSGCNIGDRGCNALCPEKGTYCGVTVTQLNLSCNHLTSSSLKDIVQMFLCWKTEQLIIAGNDINQFELRRIITSNVEQGMFECLPLQLQVIATNRSVIICDNNKYLSSSVQQDTIKLTAVVNHIAIGGAEILQSTNATVSVLNSLGVTCMVLLFEIVQIQSLNTVTNIIVEENKSKSNTISEELDEVEYVIHVFQLIRFSTPLCHLSIVNCDITDEEACQVSNSIGHDHEFLESFELMNNNINEQCLIKIITALQHSSVLRHICISTIVICNKAAKLLASVINCNTCLELLCLSHFELKEQGMLMIIESLRMIKSLRHCDFSDNYITNESAN